MGGERGCPEPVLWSLGVLKCPSINCITLLSPHNTAITIPNSQMGKLRHGEAQRLSRSQNQEVIELELNASRLAPEFTLLTTVLEIFFQPKKSLDSRRNIPQGSGQEKRLMVYEAMSPDRVSAPALSQPWLQFPELETGRDFAP